MSNWNGDPQNAPVIAEAEMECCDAPYVFRNGTTAGSQCGDSTEPCFDCRAWCCTAHSVTEKDGMFADVRFCLECAKERFLAFVCIQCQETFLNDKGTLVEARICESCVSVNEKRDARYRALRRCLAENGTVMGGLHG